MCRILSVVLLLLHHCDVWQVRCRDAGGEESCYAKGAVESVLEMCLLVESSQGAEMVEREMGEKERRRILDAARALGMKGRRCVVLYHATCHVMLCPTAARNTHAIICNPRGHESAQAEHIRDKSFMYYCSRLLECVASTTRSLAVVYNPFAISCRWRVILVVYTRYYILIYIYTGI